MKMGVISHQHIQVLGIVYTPLTSE